MASYIRCALLMLVVIQCVLVLVDGYPYRHRNHHQNHNGRHQPLTKSADVFYVDGCAGRKSLDYVDAMAECKLRYGATIASYKQLHRSLSQGYQKCSPGWLSLGTVAYPMQQRCLLCGNRVGIVSLGFRDIREKYGVFCYPNNRKVYFVQACNGTPTYATAKAECVRQGNSIATYDQLEEEWRNGYQHCKPGWLAGGRVGYPAHDRSAECGDEPGVVELQVGIEDLGERYGVYCYRSDDR
ncbi:brevican core protein-like [Ptychodera flava]|uniref:brevican core protein-like n=1 Tax=Ptychodera flava TaxID=63121 RepID=UPI00396A484D